MLERLGLMSDKELRELARLRRENAALRKKIERINRKKFGCFKCGDGNTALYCLNCANEKALTLPNGPRI